MGRSRTVRGPSGYDFPFCAAGFRYQSPPRVRAEFGRRRRFESAPGLRSLRKVPSRRESKHVGPRSVAMPTFLRMSCGDSDLHPRPGVPQNNTPQLPPGRGSAFARSAVGVPGTAPNEPDSPPDPRERKSLLDWLPSTGNVITHVTQTLCVDADYCVVTPGQHGVHTSVRLPHVRHMSSGCRSRVRRALFPCGSGVVCIRQGPVRERENGNHARSKTAVGRESVGAPQLG